MVNVLGKNVYIDTNTFRNNQTIVNVDLCGKPWVNNNMSNAFDSCINLKIINNINQNVTNMTGAFYGCTSLENAPVIPNSVTYMGSTFMGCRSLVNAPVIPNSVTDIYRLFCYCTNLVNAPVIPNSVHLMFDVFTECNNLVNAPVIPNSVTYLGCTFDRCNSLVNAPSIPNSVTDMIGTFRFCSNLVNAPSIPDSVTNMYDAFRGCSKLSNISKISNNVIDLCGTFTNCFELVNAPSIPDSVTNMAYIFYGCSNLENVSNISNNVTNLYAAFPRCNNLISVPNIPNSVLDIRYMFSESTNISGNIYIQSENITNAINCFYGTSLTKNVYIPFTYDNGVNTQTYNSFINAGYDTNGTNCGVYLKDLYPTQPYNVTDYTYTLTGKTLTLESYTGSGGDIVVPTPIEPVTVTFNIAEDNVPNLLEFKIDDTNYLGTIDSNNNISINLYEGVTYIFDWKDINGVHYDSLGGYNTVEFYQDGVYIGDARSNTFTISGTTLTMNTYNGNGYAVVRTMDITKPIYCYFVQGGCCVTEDTEILYADGTTKLAKNVSVGDIVKGYNESSKEFVDVEILQVRTPHRESLIRITLDDDSYIDCTPEHPLYSENTWGSYDEKTARESYMNDIKTEIVHIDIGSKLLQSDGSYKIIKSIEELTVNGAIKTYTFDTTNGVDTYISNNCISHNHAG